MSQRGKTTKRNKGYTYLVEKVHAYQPRCYLTERDLHSRRFIKKLEDFVPNNESRSLLELAELGHGCAQSGALLVGEVVEYRTLEAPGRSGIRSPVRKLAMLTLRHPVSRDPRN